ncbi:MAG: hypothetical protein ABFR50_03675 [Candidatus Fermentibacteria bacterium]
MGEPKAKAKAVELRHDGKTYRADNRDVFFKWAREHRISLDDSYRIAGTDKWIPVTANNELNILLDPENWWKVKMGGKTFVAPDWAAIVKWAKEGRLSVDVQIEGPKTPPGGILGKASTELSPYLREWVSDDPDKKPVRLRFDDRIFIPGSVDTLKKWILESRVPMEAEVSIQGELWQPVADCGYFDPELWPTEASLISANDGNVPVSRSKPPRYNSASKPPEVEKPQTSVRDEPVYTEGTGSDRAEAAAVANRQDKRYRITTSYGEDYTFENPEEVLSLLKRKRIHSFDEVRHPDLPDGLMFVSEYLREFMPNKRSFILLLILTILFGAAGVAAIVFQQPDAQWMMIGGIASLAIALVLLIRMIWKR